MAKRGLKDTAFHEAAHAVVRYRLRPAAYSSDITIVRRGHIIGSAVSEEIQTAIDEEGFATPVQADVDAEIEEYFAGYYASLLLGESKVVAKAGANSDLEQIEYRLQFTKTKRAILRKRAARIVKKEWAAITKVAQELLRWKTLDPTEVETIVDIVDGKCEASDLERYRALKDAANVRRNAPGNLI